VPVNNIQNWYIWMLYLTKDKSSEQRISREHHKSRFKFGTETEYHHY